MDPKEISARPDKLEKWIDDKEESVQMLKPEAKATIVWADPSNRQKTSHVLLYLHGFKASHGEGFPVHQNVARKLGINLYLSRLQSHGLADPEAFLNLKPKDFISSAIEALGIAKKLGDKVIIMGTSTGGSLALYLASRPQFKHIIDSLILYSPLVDFFGIKSLFLSNQIGRSLLRIIPGKEYRINSPGSEGENVIWYPSYNLQGALALGEFIQTYMTKELFSEVQCPVFIGYYRKNILNQDTVISVSALKRMFRQLGTLAKNKELVNFPSAQTHVICSQLLSKSVDKVEQKTVSFIQKKLKKYL